MNAEALHEIAMRARRAFETTAGHRADGTPIDLTLLTRLYLDYAPPPVDMDGWMEMAMELFPCGNCGLATVYLRHLIGEGAPVRGCYRDGGTPQFAAGSNHTFLRVGSVIVDITADQFGGPPVYVGPLTPPWYPEWPPEL